jgi:hypothetical protein
MKKSVLIKLVKEELAKKKILREENSVQEINPVDLAKGIDELIPDNTNYGIFAKAVAIIMTKYYSNLYDPFMEVLHNELGIEEGITENESAAPPTGFRPQGDLNGILSATIVDGSMVRLTAREEGSGFNKRVTSPAAVSIEEFTPEFVTKAFSTIYQPSQQDEADIEAFVQQVQNGYKAYIDYNG